MAGWPPQTSKHKLVLVISKLIKYHTYRRDHVWKLFHAGKNHNGYFSASDVCKQIKHAMDILAKHDSGEDHIFIFDNSPTHTKHGAGAPSALQMPKFSPKSKNLLVKTTDEAGKKIQVLMTGSLFGNREPQSFYWPEGQPCAGWFKGMAEIAKEQGWENAYEINVDCKKSDEPRTDCCLHHILYNEPDFANPTSIIEWLV